MSQKQIQIRIQHHRHNTGDDPDELPVEVNEISQRVSHDAQDALDSIEEVTGS